MRRRRINSSDIVLSASVSGASDGGGVIIGGSIFDFGVIPQTRDSIAQDDTQILAEQGGTT